MTLHSKISDFIFGRMKTRAIDEKVDVTDVLIDKILLHKLMDFLGMENDYNQWGLTYKKMHPHVINLVMTTPGIRPAIVAVLEKCLISKNFSKKMHEKVAKYHRERALDPKTRWGYDSWSSALDREVEKRRQNVYFSAIDEIATKLAAEDAQAIFDAGVADAINAIKQMTDKGVES